MKTKRNCIGILLCLSMYCCYSQQPSLKHIKGQKGVFLEGGVSKLGNYVKIGGALNTSRKTYLTADFFLESGKVRSFKFNTYNFTATIFYNLFSIKDRVYFNLGAGATANTSSVKAVKISETGSKENMNQFDYGLLGAVEIETFVTNRIIWLIHSDQRWFISHKFGSLAWYAGTGIKYMF